MSSKEKRPMQVFDAGGLMLSGIDIAFSAEHMDYLRAMPHHVFLYYDDVPRSPELHALLMSQECWVEMDYDRVGSSKTGFVFRIGGKLAKRGIVKASV